MPKATNALHSDQISAAQTGVAKSVVGRNARTEEGGGFCGAELIRNGCDAARLSDTALEGSDVWATAYAIAQALRKLDFDLLIVGGLTDDSSTGAVPGALAEHLGLPCVTNARKVEIAGDGLEVERETDTGYQTVRTPLPALLTTALTFGEPRYASLKGIMGAKKKTIAAMSLADLALEQPVGTSGSKTELRSFSPPAARGKGRTVEAADGLAGAQAIFDFLREKKLV